MFNDSLSQQQTLFAEPQSPLNASEQYLTIDELSARIKYSKQSIYNLIHRKVLMQQTHFFKPTPKKLLFKWSAIQDWVEGKASDVTATETTKHPAPTLKPPLSRDTKSRINI